ncbi:MAG TPA: SDR family oxidoreductase, partial [Myxococcota bacterium]|nr:SDR family oxidoreductase [Myxococcota bacterium]
MAVILITSATGKVAEATFAALRGSGHGLIALVRNPDKAQALQAQGITVRRGDLERPHTLEGAFDGVDRALIIAPAGYMAPALASNALWAARQARVGHIVRLSAVGAAHDAPTVNSRLHALSDSELLASGIAHTILKPHFFSQNLLGMASQIKSQGAFSFALGEATLPIIDVRDIGAVAAAILGAPAGHAGKVYTLTGPEAVSMHGVAAALAQATGKAVKYVPVPVAQATAAMEQHGADVYTVAAMRDYLTAYSRNWQNTPTPAVAQITGN